MIIKNFLASAITISALLFSGCAEMTLQDAVVYNHPPYVTQLLNSGYPVDQLDEYGNTPLINASANANINYQIITTLIERGANVNHQNQFFDTPLVRASITGRLDIANLLIEKGANVNTINTLGNTPLILAVAWNHPSIAKLLIEKGADITPKNHKGESALFWAQKNNLTSLYPLLDATHTATAEIKKPTEPTSELNTLLANKDYKGLRAYLDEHPEYLNAITDETIRLHYTGPKTLRIVDIEKLSKMKKKDSIIIAQINASGGPYKIFSADEMSILETMGISDDVVAAMINITTEYTKEQKALSQQKQQQIQVIQQQPVQQQQVVQQPQEGSNVGDALIEGAAKELGSQLIRQFF